ncbi:MAG: response regulator [Planctomycetes bacterium]|nr:response regulator [Planctomycetota bacterium]
MSLEQEPISLPPLPARILVMDDEASVRSIVRRILERKGCTVLEAADGEEAVRVYSESLTQGPAIAAVIMDLSVPGGMGGLAAAAKVRELDPAARIIVASGYFDDRTLSDLDVLGSSGRLSKPFGPDDLVRTLTDALTDAGEAAEDAGAAS